MFNKEKVLVIISLIVGLYILYKVGVVSRTESFYPVTTSPVTIDEFGGFVGWNTYNVGNEQISMVKADQLVLENTFKRLIEEDRGKLDLRNAGDFRSQPLNREQGEAYIKYILNRINNRTDRRFNILDVQTLYKDTALDKKSGSLINRFKTELFIQEKDSRKVSAHAMNIRIVFMVKDYEMQIEELHFITDNYYKRPLVDGYNPAIVSGARSPGGFGTEYFRIMNPFHLNQPFLTSEDKVLPPSNEQEFALFNHDREAAKPQYRCFEGTDSTGTTPDNCDLSNGYWDKPVVNDEECPYFMKNKNYPNRLGGVDPNGNRCELPIGAKLIGYRYPSADPIHKPWCYNCNIGADGQPGSIGPCCDEQLNKELYPNLVSPDYAYPGDSLERGQFWQELSERGLNWQQHPTSIQDVTNPRQKAPVFNAIIGPGPV